MDVTAGRHFKEGKNVKPGKVSHRRAKQYDEMAAMNIRAAADARKYGLDKVAKEMEASAAEHRKTAAEYRSGFWEKERRSYTRKVTW